MDLRQQNKHLMNRAGFGISLDDYAHPQPIHTLVERLFPAVGAPEALAIVTYDEWERNSPKAMKEMEDNESRKEAEKAFRQRTKDLNKLWTSTMVTTQYPLLEKTALFWHGHFATRIDNPYFDQVLLDIIRRNALGKFGDLLSEVSKSSSMLKYLNNKQNRKEHPNENFARELMELFTLGRGHYTEDDVKEAARAFTGWSFDEDGRFIFRQRQHDDGEKTILGKTGKWTGDDVIRMLLEQKQTAAFLVQKIYRYFVSDEKIDPRHLKQLASDFYESNYDIGKLLQSIFTPPWFYDTQLAGAKVKSPVELLVGYQRMLPIQFENEKTIINLQRTLGQYLFNPPNVAGWPGGRNWIDSSSLVIRMRLPEAFFLSKELNLSLKETDLEMAVMQQQPIAKDSPPSRAFRVGKVQADWTAFTAYWGAFEMNELPRALADFLLPESISDEQLRSLISFADKDNKQEYIKSLTILIMELPEYQLA